MTVFVVIHLDYDYDDSARASIMGIYHTRDRAKQSIINNESDRRWFPDKRFKAGGYYVNLHLGGCCDIYEAELKQ